MRIKNISDLEQKILPELDGFALSGPLLLINPIENVLRGIYFERSSYDKLAFSVTFFAMLLCVPAQHLSFNFGGRVRHKGGGDRWTLSMPDLLNEIVSEIRNQALPFLSRVSSLLSFADAAITYSGNPHTPKAIAFALARANQHQRAIAMLDELLAQLDLKISWHQTIADQAEKLRSKLAASPEDAHRQLNDWEVETTRNLKLERFRN